MRADKEIKTYKHYYGRIITPFGKTVHPATAKEPTKPKINW